MYKQYGKPSGPLLKQKTSFFEDNDKHVAKQRKIADVYQQQPLRTVCKNCNNGIKDEIDDNGNPEYQGLDTSRLVPVLVATIKELEARITALENA